MDPHVVFDCQKLLPNRFALTLAATARSRALVRGAAPRLDATTSGSVSELALHEIAKGAFGDDELTPFLPGSSWKAISSSSRSGFRASRRRLGERRRTRLPPAGDGSLMRQANRQGGMNDAEVSVFK
jgi:DNA-directed RNA polymerase subunit K/omega